MITSGYNILQTRHVIISGIRFYKEKITEAEHAGQSINRDLRNNRSRLQRLIKLKTDKTMWNKNKNGKNSKNSEPCKSDKLKQKPDLGKQCS